MKTLRLLSAAALTAAIALIGASPAVAGPRADRAAMLAPIAVFDKALVAHKSEIVAAGAAFEDQTRACLNADGSVQAGPGTPGDLVFNAFTLTVLDGVQASLAPVNADLRRAADRYAKAKISDKILRDGARAQARVLRRFLALPQLDTCATLARWQVEGVTAANTPQALRENAADRRDDRQIKAAAKRLRKLGATAKQATAFEMFPLGENEQYGNDGF